jgi:hypothetical protein
MSELPVQNEPVESTEEMKDRMNDAMNEEMKDETKTRTWIEEIEVAGSQLVERVKELVAEGNVRRLILRTQDDRLILEIPLTAGAVVGGVVTLFAPLLAALGALAALLARVKVQVVRSEGDDSPQ